MENSTELVKRVLHFNKLWKDIPPAVVRTGFQWELLGP